MIDCKLLDNMSIIHDLTSMCYYKEDTLKFRHDLFQASAILTAPRFATVVLAATATFALAGCGGGGSPNITAPPR